MKVLFFLTLPVILLLIAITLHVGELFFLILPIVVLLIAIELSITIWKNRVGGREPVKHSLLRTVGLLGLSITFFIGVYGLYIALMALPYFCNHTGCQAGGYVYMAVTMVVLVSYPVSFIVALAGKYGFTGKKP